MLLIYKTFAAIVQVIGSCELESGAFFYRGQSSLNHFLVKTGLSVFCEWPMTPSWYMRTDGDGVLHHTYSTPPWGTVINCRRPQFVITAPWPPHSSPCNLRQQWLLTNSVLRPKRLSISKVKVSFSPIYMTGTQCKQSQSLARLQRGGH